MASELIVRNKNNIPIGFVKETGSQKIATHYKKGYVGFYSISSDITFDKDGKIYCYGDGSTSLIRDAD